MGAFGMVMRGTINGGKFLVPLDVAVKSVKPNAAPEYIKSLLTELKVMIYVGNNQNIVGLVGACTQDLNLSKLHAMSPTPNVEREFDGFVKL